MAQLIKLSSDHYIIVDDSYIEMDDYYLDDTNTVRCAITEAESYWTHRKHYKKVTHSTQPLGFLQEEGITTANLKLTYGSVQQLSLSEVKELIGDEHSLKNMWYERNVQNPYSSDSQSHAAFDKGFELGYNQSLEDNKDKKYTEKDMRMAMDKMSVVSYSSEFGMSSNYKERKRYIDAYIKSHQPKAEWEVEFIDGKLKLI